MQGERESARATRTKLDEFLSLTQCFDKADIGMKHMTVSRLIERVDVSTIYQVHIKLKLSLEQFLGQSI